MVKRGRDSAPEGRHYDPPSSPLTPQAKKSRVGTTITEPPTETVGVDLNANLPLDIEADTLPQGKALDEGQSSGDAGAALENSGVQVSKLQVSKSVTKPEDAAVSKEKLKGLGFAAAMAKLRPGVSSGTPPVYLSDADCRELKSLPSECGVTKEDYQDDILKDTYANLLCLSPGAFRSWSEQNNGPHPMSFSGWATTCPDLDFGNALAALMFTHDGHYVNPSRVDPLMLSARSITADNTRYNLEIKTTAPSVYELAFCITPIRVTKSLLLFASGTGSGSTRESKYIYGCAHSQDWERMVSTLCMVFGEETLDAQVYGADLQYSTQSRSKDSPTPSPSKGSIASRPAQATSAGSGRFAALRALDEVPVYDARTPGQDITFDANLFNNLDKRLAKYDDEVPVNSYAIVGYTVSYWKTPKKASWNISHNVRWVILLACPDA
ncbi:hypothetical protein NP233_g8088 [Leucocoprinus birnbaumii]|uniref:Uncharacterized protein n=1 Tax=Leucocoprinus birnbaumii TaxID=56174 RepID=A0AAD5VNQ3_9AGAR|nr:hypothetical protein NP233_g8088 [Leucocoprinus birnbaumii]